MPADEVEAEASPDGSWVSLTGTIVDVSLTQFVLDYGDGEITVEMDDWDFDGDARPLLINDKVAVFGYVDDDLFEKRTIEASSVYVKDLGTYFYASGADEEDFPPVPVTVTTPEIELVGTVTAVSGRELMVDTGVAIIEVNTEELGYNPLDDVGFQQIDVGDRVRVQGELGTDFLADRDLIADSITSIS
jgi:hypothetical protein